MPGRRSVWLAILILAASLAAGPAAFGSDRKLKEAELAKLRERISRLQQDLQQVRGQYDNLRNELRNAERKIGRLATELRDTEAALKQQQRKLAGLKDRENELQASVATQRLHLTRQVRAAYAMGGQEYLKLLLNQEDPAAVGRVMAYYDHLNRARTEHIRDLATTLDKLARVRDELEAESRRLAELRERQLSEKRDLESSRKERKVLLVKLKTEINTKDKRLGRMSADERQLAALLQSLSQALEDIPAETRHQSFARLRGKLDWPARGGLKVTYGSERAHGAMRWNGVLIGAGEGQEVKAISHGRVAFADWLRGYGLLIIVDHGDGYMSLYGHNQSLYKETGDWVEAGEPIATVGNSGGQEQAALYFEIRHNGKPQDPARWCKRRG